MSRPVRGRLPDQSRFAPNPDSFHLKARARGLWSPNKRTRRPGSWGLNESRQQAHCLALPCGENQGWLVGGAKSSEGGAKCLGWGLGLGAGPSAWGGA